MEQNHLEQAQGAQDPGGAPQGAGMSPLCQGDFEGWVVEGPGPEPGIWVTMETDPKGDNKHGMEFQRLQPDRRGRGMGKFRKVLFVFNPRVGGATGGSNSVPNKGSLPCTST